ncbi:MAG: hypothetical protein ABIU09_05215 [Pyrinomonadaceae bacterium]
MDRFLNDNHGLWFRDQAEPNGKIVLSTANLKASWLSDEHRRRFVTMSQSAVQAKADTSGDFVYVSIGKLEVKGSCVAASLDNHWAVGKNSGMGYVSGGGFTYEFRKVGGNWSAKVVLGWIS